MLSNRRPNYFWRFRRKRNPGLKQVQNLTPRRANGDVNYRDLRKGDPGLVSDKPIGNIILRADDFIVYLDTDDNIMWNTKPEYTGYPADFGLITNEMAHLEILIDRHLEGRERAQFKALAAEGMARLLDDKESALAKQILEKAKEEAVCLIREKLRVKYLQGSLTMALFTLVILLICLRMKTDIKSYSEQSYSLVLSCLCGGFGAFISSFLTSRTYQANPAIGAYIHLIDGLFRIIYGFVAAFFVYMGIKANAILGFVEGGNGTANNYIFFFFCTLAGASEALIPNIIRQKENSEGT